MFFLSDFGNQSLSLIVEDGENYTVVNNEVIPDQYFVGVLDVSMKVDDGYKNSNSLVIEVIVNALTSIKSLQPFEIEGVYLVFNSENVNSTLSIYSLNGRLVQSSQVQNRIAISALKLI